MRIFNDIHLGNLRGDLFGGVTAAIIALPMALAFGVASGAGAGLYGAVLAGIAVKVGIDIIDWGFMRRAHKVSIKGALLMYGVILLTVFVDLITAVGIGVFIANVITIRRLADLQAEGVCTFGSADTDASGSQCQPLAAEECDLLRRAGGKVMLLQLSGPLIFGAAKAISRQAPALADARALVVDMANVNHIGVTPALAVETAIQDAVDCGATVFLVGVEGQPRERFEALELSRRVPPEHWLEGRMEALVKAEQAAGPASAVQDKS